MFSEHTQHFLFQGQPAQGLRDRLLNAYSAELRRLSPKKLQVNGNKVSFTAGLFRLRLSTNLLTGIGRGQIVLSDSERGTTVCYWISFRELIVVATVLILFMLLSIFSTEGLEPLPILAVLLPMGWLWLVGGNIAIAILRFNRFIKRHANLAGATEISTLDPLRSRRIPV